MDRARGGETPGEGRQSSGDPALRHRLRRGMLELDLILGRYHREAYPHLNDGDRRAFSRLLESEDDRLWDWLTGRSDPDHRDVADAVRRVRQHAGL